jgi:inosine/xanthosine triphosphatase
MKQTVVELKPVVVFCGSMSAMQEMLNYKAYLEEFGFEVLVPDNSENDIVGYLDQMTTTQKIIDRKISGNFIQKHIELIRSADAILVVNSTKNGVQGYIGGNTFGEVFAALTLGVPIYYTEQPARDLSYTSEIYGMPFKVSLTSLIVDFKNAKTVSVATISELKLRGVRDAFRKAGILTKVSGYASVSGVSEQPKGWDETLLGALNRIDRLAAPEADYRVSYEGGVLEDDAQVHSIGISIIHERKSGSVVRSRSLGLQIPEEAVDLFSTGKYLDYGILVQEAYGVKEKDTCSLFSNGKITRQSSVTEAVYKCIVQL